MIEAGNSVVRRLGFQLDIQQSKVVLGVVLVGSVISKVVHKEHVGADPEGLGQPTEQIFRLCITRQSGKEIAILVSW